MINCVVYLTNMAQNNGLLVDVDIETATVGTEKVENNSSVTLGGSDEVNSNVSNNKNIFDKIDTIQTYQNSLEIEASEERRQRNSPCTRANHRRYCFY